MTPIEEAEDYHLLLDGAGVLSRSLDEPVNLSRPAIDVLFACRPCRTRETFLSTRWPRLSMPGR
jgi:hypothetical protein